MPQRKVISIRLADTSYDVIIEAGLLARAGEIIASLAPSNRVLLVRDAGLPRAHVDTLRNALPRTHIADYELPSGEENKTLTRVTQALDRFLAQGVDRKTPLITLGGGVTGDLGGFVAATLLRGLPLVQIPTTLLAMVDASVGGKTGVNHREYKNMIGAFKQPIAVLIDPSLLRTLPDAELRNGLAECIKHAVIRDAALFDWTSQRLDQLLAREESVLTELIAHNVAIKAQVVQADPFESGERMHLNFGHTFGHAIETASGHAYSHGQAVALGMCAACYAASKLLMLSREDRERVVDLIHRAGLATTKLSLDISSLISAMTHDKKASQGKIRLVLPTRIGAVTVRDDVPESIIHESFQSLRGS